MGLHYLTFMRRNIEDQKKLTPVGIMKCWICSIGVITIGHEVPHSLRRHDLMHANVVVDNGLASFL